MDKLFACNTVYVLNDRATSQKRYQPLLTQLKFIAVTANGPISRVPVPILVCDEVQGISIHPLPLFWQCLNARRHPDIIWTDVDLSSVRSSDVHLGQFDTKAPQPLITKACLIITYSRLHIKSPRRRYVIHMYCAWSYPIPNGAACKIDKHFRFLWFATTVYIYTYIYIYIYVYIYSKLIVIDSILHWIFFESIMYTVVNIIGVT